jgi:hypothetical protein
VHGKKGEEGRGRERKGEEGRGRERGRETETVPGIGFRGRVRQ